MNFKLSIYWKCQLLGWGSYVIIAYGFNNIVDKDFVGFFYKAIIMFFFGLVFSHLIKISIDKTGILQKKFIFQIIYLTILIIVFSMIGTYVWMITLIKTGVWDIKELKKSQPDVFFYMVYFYNLFPILLTIAGWVLIYFLVHYIRRVRKEEQLKLHYKLQMTEFEAKALRAQMNPHFIFNCLNSIKSLIQQNENEKSVIYLTTFSKLIRTLLNNADKKEISLFDEIETCKLYLPLEAMRFDTKFSYAVNVDDTIDLKSIQVPALIIQPFIENAIWHGIVPRNAGGKLLLNVLRKDGVIEIIIDDDGIGREASQQNNSASGLVHQSKGINLTQTRLELNNLLQQKQAELEVIDKRDENSVATGTTIIIKIKEELS